MKFLLVLVVVLAVIWFLRNHRRNDERKPDPPPRDAVGEPQDMVRCPVCSLHLPRTDALPGVDGSFYCCADHRSRAGE
jgi:uncharacterized protein